MTELVVDFCSYEAAKYAVMHWHYSKRMPSGKLVKLGVWECGKYIGAVVFGRGAIYRIGDPYELTQTECVELVRIALTDHVNPVTKILSQCFKILKAHNPGLRLVVSFADASQGHNGTVYQAANWVFTGEITMPTNVIVNGETMHRRSAHARYGTYAMDWLKNNVDPNARYDASVTKYKYIYPLDRAMRRQIATLAQPYPKTCGPGVKGDTVTDQVAEAGSIPAVRSI